MEHPCTQGVYKGSNNQEQKLQESKKSRKDEKDNSEDNSEVNYKCKLFEFKRIACRHQILVFIHRKIYRIPHKYILN